MTDRFPLIINSEDQQIQELSSGDNLDLTGSGIVADVFTVDTNSQERLRIDSSGNVLIGGSTQATADIALNANGSAVFAGNLNVSGFVRGGANNTLYIADDIALTSGKSLMLGDANTKISNDGIACTVDILGTEGLRINDGKVSIYSGAIDLNYNGSAEFESSLTSKYASKGMVQTAASIVHGVMVKDASANINATIDWDGSATFANYITSGVGDPGIPNIGYININGPSGKIYISKSTSAAVQIFDSNNNRNAILLNGDGSAIFGPFDTNSNSGFGSKIDMHGNFSGVRVQSASNATSVGEFFAGYRGTSPVFQVTTGGNATFAGYVKADTNLICDTTSSSNGLYIGDFTNGNYYATIFGNGSATFGQGLTSGSGVNLYPVGQQSIRRDTAGNAIEVLSGGGISGNITASIKNDGSASFGSDGDQGVKAGYIARATSNVNAGLGFANFGPPGIGIYPSNATSATVDNGLIFGTPSGRWKVIYAATGSINTSDANEKQDVRDLEASELAAATELKTMIKAYRWKDAVSAKGDDARIHFGVIAQDVQSMFTKHGLDASKYGFWCSDTWYELDGDVVHPDENGEYPEGVTPKTRLGIRYDELFAFIISAL